MRERRQQWFAVVLVALMLAFRPVIGGEQPQVVHATAPTPIPVQPNDPGGHGGGGGGII